jgi:hypothetical protein
MAAAELALFAERSAARKTLTVYIAPLAAHQPMPKVAVGTSSVLVGSVRAMLPCRVAPGGAGLSRTADAAVVKIALDPTAVAGADDADDDDEELRAALPEALGGLDCRRCGAELLGGQTRRPVLALPSEHWIELSDLWCVRWQRKHCSA